MAETIDITQRLDVKGTATYAIRSHNKPTNIDTWHCPLVHIGYQTLKFVINSMIITLVCQGL